MTLTEARDIVRRAIRDGNDDTMFPTLDVDRTIQFAGDRFVNKTRLLKASNDVAIAESVADFPITTLVTAGFRPDRLIVATLISPTDTIDGKALTVVSYEELIRLKDTSTTEAMPQALNFLSWTSASVWPTPDQAYTAKVLWYPPFTVFTAGTTDPGSVTLNISDDLLRPVLIYGAASVLTLPTKDRKFAAEAWAAYLEFEKSHMGAGNMGVKAIQLTRRSERQ